MAEMLRKRDSRGSAVRHSVGTLVFVSVAAFAQVDVERQFEAAVHREIVAGDLKGALEDYRAILALPSKSRAMAARALFRTGQCLEKQGNAAEAMPLYRRLLNEYGEQGAVANTARARLKASGDGRSSPRNLLFQEGTPGKVPPGWFVPALPKDANYMAELRRDHCRSGAGCAVVMVPGNAPRPSSQLMQTFSAEPYRGATVRLRAWLRVEPAGPDDHAQMWLSVDRQNHGRGFYDNMDDRPVRSSEWTQCEIVGTIHEDATFIDIGVMSIGRGRVWVDSVSLEILK
jgi:hypothetical protein